MARANKFGPVKWKYDCGMLADSGLWRNLIKILLGNLGIFQDPGSLQTISLSSFRGANTTPG